MLGLEGREVHQSAAGWSPVWLEDNLGVMSIGFMLPDKDDAIIWRGPKKNGIRGGWCVTCPATYHHLNRGLCARFDQAVFDGCGLGGSGLPHCRQYVCVVHQAHPACACCCCYSRAAPPGTSDEHISIVQYLKGSVIAGAVVVTTPQEVAMMDVRKEINFCQKTGVPVLGVVENMSGFVCPGCKVRLPS